VVTGPSGVGKGTLIRALRERMPGLRLSVSATTRAPRPGEEHGSDYWFLGEDEFDERLRRGEFLEHATYAGNRYGTLRSEIDRAPGGDSNGERQDPSGLVLEIELQGARQVREALPEAVQVFVRPPSLDALRARLVGRGAESPEQVENRLQAAADEMAAADAGEFDHVVVNDRLEDAVQELVDLVATIWGPRAKDSPE
jgi:guanylate kinase